MLKGKHLVMIAAAIGLLIGPIPSEATVILQAVAGTVQVGGPGGVGKDFGPRKVPHMPPGVGSPPQFVFDQDAGPPADTRRYEADFDFPNDGIVYFFYITNKRDIAAEEIVWESNDRCNQENLIAQLKSGVHRAPHPKILAGAEYCARANDLAL